MAPAVRVNAVAPTWTLTPFWRDVPADDLARTQAHFEENIPLKRLATMDELAAAYIFLMENGFVTGQRLAVDGGIMLG
ncbi:SDR family oxidoreductase [Mangrovibacter sp. SLW1]